jgi:hypothetical protein
LGCWCAFQKILQEQVTSLSAHSTVRATTPPSADFKVIPVQGYALVLNIINAKLIAMIF